jgi:hypothetical protein
MNNFSLSWFISNLAKIEDYEKVKEIQIIYKIK